MKIESTVLILSLFVSLQAGAVITKPFGFFKTPKLPSNKIMRPGDTVPLPAVLAVDNYYLAPQSDGNTVIYRDSDGAVMWYTNTWSGSGSCTGCTLKFQTDGNLVLLNGATVKWSSNTPGAAGGFVMFRNKTPNLIIYNASGGWVWNN